MKLLRLKLYGLQNQPFTKSESKQSYNVNYKYKTYGLQANEP